MPNGAINIEDDLIKNFLSLDVGLSQPEVKSSIKQSSLPSVASYVQTVVFNSLH
jgi:hypothetical protein